MKRGPSQAVIDHVRNAMRTAIDRAPHADMEWVRRHFIYHNHASYFVIPNLFSGDRENEDEYKKAIAMNQLAGVLDDMNLVRWPTKSELKKLIKEEKTGSLTDLTKIRKWRLAELEKRKAAGENIKLDEKKAEQIRSAEPVRNHGLFSKAERMLAFNGWSDPAQDDFEIYRLVDTEGLTPLLIVLSQDEKGAQQANDKSSQTGQDGKPS